MYRYCQEYWKKHLETEWTIGKNIRILKKHNTFIDTCIEVEIDKYLKTISMEGQGSSYVASYCEKNRFQLNMGKRKK